MGQLDHGCLKDWGQAGTQLRAVDWSVHPLGPPPRWPLSLQTTVRTVLNCRFPMLLCWGTDLFAFYNDAYAPLLGGGHPGGLGQPLQQGWGDVYGRIAPTFARVRAGDTVYVEDARYTLDHERGPSDAYFTHGYSPVWGDTGEIEGILLVGTETTRRVVAERDLQRTNKQLVEQVAALRSSEAQFRMLAQALPNHVWTASPAGLLDWFNDRVYEYSGAAVGVLDGRGWTRIVHPDDARIAATRWASGLTSGESYEMEFRLRRADGVYRWHLARAVPIRATDGTIIRWIGTNTDIEDQKQAAHALAHLNESLEQQVTARTDDRNRLWQLSTDIMMVAQFDGLITAVNPAWTAKLGWTDQELVGRNILDLIHPDDAERSADAARNLAEGESLRRFEIRYRHRNGFYRWINWTAVPGEGLINAVGRDVTLDKERTAALERSEARLRSVFETSYQYQGLMSIDGILLDANPTSLAGIEARLEDVVGKPFWETPWFTGTPGLPKQVQAAIPKVASGQVVRQEISVNLPTGWRVFDFSMRPVLSPAGEVIAIVPEAIEITERRIAEEQLRQAQKMEALGQLTGGIAHDFNNLLTGITGSLDLIRRRLADGRTDDLGRFMDAASTAAQRATSLTHRLLAFARRQSLDTRATDANALIVSLEDMLRRSLGETISLGTMLHEDLRPAFTDANQLESAILNLAINARDAMPNGGCLTIETRNTHLDDAYALVHDDVEAGPYVEIAVSDNGDGMPADIVAKAFDPFFTTKPIGQGTGLGLSMIYGFVKQSGGHVRIYSEVGQGTTVKLYLRPARHEAGAKAIEPVDSAPRGQGETVLVVEDDATVRLLITEVLEELGYRFIEAANGREALPVLESDQPVDLLVTDVGLPVMNGRQLAEIARQLRPDLRVLFVTGYAENAAVRSGFLAPGMEMMSKPFDLEALGAKIRGLLEH